MVRPITNARWPLRSYKAAFTVFASEDALLAFMRVRAREWTVSLCFHARLLRVPPVRACGRVTGPAC